MVFCQDFCCDHDFAITTNLLFVHSWNFDFSLLVDRIFCSFAWISFWNSSVLPHLQNDSPPSNRLLLDVCHSKVIWGQLIETTYKLDFCCWNKVRHLSITLVLFRICGLICRRTFQIAKWHSSTSSLSTLWPLALTCAYQYIRYYLVDYKSRKSFFGLL